MNVALKDLHISEIFLQVFKIVFLSPFLSLYWTIFAPPFKARVVICNVFLPRVKLGSIITYRPLIILF